MLWSCFALSIPILLAATSCGSMQSSANLQSNGRSPSKNDAQVRGEGTKQSIDIRQVDFRNFTFHADSACIDEKEPVLVRDGKFRNESKKFDISVTDIIYGDLTGDGQDEAVVRLLCIGISSSRADEAILYTMQAGQPVPISQLDPGHGAFGSIWSIGISNGILTVERLSSEIDAATPQYVDTEMLRWDGRQLIEAGEPKRRRYVQERRSELENRNGRSQERELSRVH